MEYFNYLKNIDDITLIHLGREMVKFSEGNNEVGFYLRQYIRLIQKETPDMKLPDVYDLMKKTITNEIVRRFCHI